MGFTSARLQKATLKAPLKVMLKLPGKINNNQPRHKSRGLSGIAHRIVNLLTSLDVMVINPCYQRIFEQVPVWLKGYQADIKERILK